MVLQSKIYLSWVLKSSLDNIYKLAKEADNPLKRIEYNIIIITLLVMKLEAQMNEITNSIKEWKKVKFNLKIIDFINQNEKSLSVSQKYDLIAIELNMEIWQNDREPFQSIEKLVSLRNELSHYKGDYLKIGKGLNNKITSLLDKITNSTSGEKGKYSNHWITDLIGSENLIEWLDSVGSKIDQLEKNLLKNIT